jgi:hypothetical protein
MPPRVRRSFVDPETAFEVEQLVTRYIHLVDDSDWESLRDVFTDDAVCDYSAFGLPVIRGLDSIIRTFSSMGHPLSHHAVNMLIEPGENDSALRVRSKLLLVMGARKIWAGEYRDRVVHTPVGWLFAERTAVQPARRQSSGSFE